MVGDSSVDVVTVEVYASSNTDLMADGHSLPFRDTAFDGVWIQAVLEHVLEPQRVVAEIYRVLKPKGIVYAETPFMSRSMRVPKISPASVRVVIAGCFGTSPR